MLTLGIPVHPLAGVLIDRYRPQSGFEPSATRTSPLFAVPENEASKVAVEKSPFGFDAFPNLT